MAPLISALLECICIPSEDHPPIECGKSSTPKVTYDLKCREEPQPFYKSTSQSTSEIIGLLQSAEKPGSQLTASVDQIAAQAGGWSEYIARCILTALETLLKEGGKVEWGQALQEAYQKASDAAREVADFAKAHPVLCTVVALGILVILAPAVIHVLGFGVLGPVEGSFAAAWQSTYGGFVEAGSLFSLLQKLGMLY